MMKLFFKQSDEILLIHQWCTLGYKNLKIKQCEAFAEKSNEVNKIRLDIKKLLKTMENN